MTITNILYNILIGPLELLFEIIFVVTNRLVENPGFSIIVLSLAMNILVLPLYRRADALQEEERDKEISLKPWVDHIKRTFKGDERFMILQTYYRQNGYKPTHVLKGSISLLLEIPFFIAAYHFLSSLPILTGIGFGPIKDLGAPDGMIQVASYSINVLPILMTLINLVSASIYLKGFPMRSKIQMYGIAAIFLILLYQSPAGLVFYWTLNNVFSLGKNIFYKLKNPQRVLRIGLSIIGAVSLVLVLIFQPVSGIRRMGFLILLSLCLQIPEVSHFIKKGEIKVLNELDKTSDKLFYYSVTLLVILTGILIPSALMKGSVQEFIDVNEYYSPLWIIVASLTMAVGTFLVWFVIFYKLAGNRGKIMMTIVTVLLAIVSTIDYMFFGTNYGNISAQLQYDKTPEFTFSDTALNLLIILLIIFLLSYAFYKKEQLLNLVIGVMIVAITCMSVVNINGIKKEIDDANNLIKIANKSEKNVELQLSRYGKNVIFLMMDRQLGQLIPFLFEEKPELKKQFAGFTYYPNTVSFGNFTNVGAPALFGGYDYTPERMNARKNEKLSVKHDEALKVMPTVFSDAGYDVTICDPPYAGYGWIPDLTVFSGIPRTHAYITYGKYELPEYGFTPFSETEKKNRFRNIFCYSLFKISPVLFRGTIYEKGNYNNSRPGGYREQTLYGLSKSVGLREQFMEAYGVLQNLENMTTIEDKENNNFFMISNVTTHEEMLLKEPEYIPSDQVDNTKYDDSHATRETDAGDILKMNSENIVKHYHVNMASMLKLGQWFDYLREQGVYDNSRIIIVSDHGRDFDGKFFEYQTESGETKKMDISWFQCALMVKDFNSTKYRVDDRFSTNADGPAYAMDGLIDNPENPFTKNEIVTYNESGVSPHLIFTLDHRTDINNGNCYLPAEWFEVSEDIRNLKNWSYLGEY